MNIAFSILYPVYNAVKELGAPVYSEQSILEPLISTHSAPPPWTAPANVTCKKVYSSGNTPRKGIPLVKVHL